MEEKENEKMRPLSWHRIQSLKCPGSQVKKAQLLLMGDGKGDLKITGCFCFYLFEM
jgi:hypothetical protein